MKLIIHDGNPRKIREIFPEDGDTVYVEDNHTIQNCVGCFGCWIKTPGKCVLNDRYNNMGPLIGKADKLILVSECWYGGYSPFVKAVLERSIPYMHPFFIVKNNEMHHKDRYNNRFSLKVLFYGENVTEAEKETAEKLVRANAVNFSCSDADVKFFKNLEELGGDCR
ncbi:MAG: flavodoxin family protein [Fusobacteriaceae bacterium]|jgi:multimeric flavodoxin WrbA|nr:flavodoxin family protein [Fusobacteriaceae bacterium]